MTTLYSVAWYIVGLLVWYTFAWLGSNGWHTYFYLWDKGKDVLFLLCIYHLVKTEYKWVIRLIVIFSAIRLGWEIVSLITGWNVNNKRTVAGLFIVLTATISLILFKELVKWQRQKLRRYS